MHRAALLSAMVAVVAALALCAGCEDDKVLFLGSKEEASIGRSVDGNLVDKYGLSRSRRQATRIQSIGGKVAAHSRRKNVTFRFRLLAGSEVNAFAAPGGYVYVTDGLMDFIGSDTSAVACILAHEVGHVDRRHSMQRLERQMGAQLLIQLALGRDAGAKLATTATDLVLLGYGREQEFQADEIGVTYGSRAGYDPWGLVRFLEKLKQKEGRPPADFVTFFRTHPPTGDRIRHATNYIKQHNLG